MYASLAGEAVGRSDIVLDGGSAICNDPEDAPQSIKCKMTWHGGVSRRE